MYKLFNINKTEPFVMYKIIEGRKKKRKLYKGIMGLGHILKICHEMLYMYLQKNHKVRIFIK